MNIEQSIVYIIDDDPDVRNALSNLLQSAGAAVECFSSTAQFLKANRPDMPSCILLDMRFPDSSQDGLDFQKRLAEKGIMVPVIFITGYGDARSSTQAMKGGAIDFLLKPIRKQELLAAVSSATDRHQNFREHQQMLSSLRMRMNGLSAREKEVMTLVTQGLRNKQIAAGLGLSEITVKVHRSHMMQKMQVNSVADLVRICETLRANGEASPLVETPNIGVKKIAPKKIVPMPQRSGSYK